MSNRLPPDRQSADRQPLDLVWFQGCMDKAAALGKWAEWGTLTVAIATLLLTRNDENRNKKRLGIEDLVHALRMGDWTENGETIKISKEGLMNDGQHRCEAVVRTGIPAPTLFAFGVTRESRKTVDLTHRRTPGDILKFNGVLNSNTVAASLRNIINLERGLSLNTTHTGADIERALVLHPHPICHQAIQAATRFHQSCGLFNAIHHLTSVTYPDEATYFFQMLANGVAPHAKHPAARLSQRLSANLAAKAKLPATEIAAITIKALQAFIGGEDIGVLRWSGNEDFPMVPS